MPRDEREYLPHFSMRHATRDLMKKRRRDEEDHSPFLALRWRAAMMPMLGLFVLCQNILAGAMQAVLLTLFRLSMATHICR